jgi:hypothetical protein
VSLPQPTAVSAGIRLERAPATTVAAQQGTGSLTLEQYCVGVLGPGKVVDGAAGDEPRERKITSVVTPAMATTATAIRTAMRVW